MKAKGALLVVGVGVLVAAYFGRVQWDEEVLLNSGEKVWVTRSVFYAPGGSPGNPFDFHLRPRSEERISFTHAGKKYSYKGDADLMLLAISPKGTPVLVAPAENKSWDWSHNFYCARPHYVQLIPDQSGETWSWPSEIEPWLYGLAANLMRHRSEWSQMKERYTIQDTVTADAVARMQFPSRASVDPNHLADPRACKRKSP